jgi:hypothetical protein
MNVKVVVNGISGGGERIAKGDKDGSTLYIYLCTYVCRQHNVSKMLVAYDYNPSYLGG